MMTSSIMKADHDRAGIAQFLMFASVKKVASPL